MTTFLLETTREVLSGITARNLPTLCIVNVDVTATSNADGAGRISPQSVVWSVAGEHRA